MKIKKKVSKRDIFPLDNDTISGYNIPQKATNGNNHKGGTSP
jgi:hypothetical protein